MKQAKEAFCQNKHDKQNSDSDSNTFSATSNYIQWNPAIRGGHAPGRLASNENPRTIDAH